MTSGKQTAKSDLLRTYHCTAACTPGWAGGGGIRGRGAGGAGLGVFRGDFHTDLVFTIDD